jgi:NTP pyrophosphatase (non-canonical NTP hydrolase)
MEMNDKTREAMLILQEECAEVAQAISKVFRFGIDTVHNMNSNRQRLEEEIGDLLAMVDILIESSIISDSNVNEARKNKKNKLRKWSSIYN